MRFDPQRATDLLINNITHVPVKRVVDQLKPEPQLQLVYLHNLFYSYKDKKDSKEINQAGKEFHNLQVKLYATYNREPLYDFLEKVNFYFFYVIFFRVVFGILKKHWKCVDLINCGKKWCSFMEEWETLKKPLT